MRGDEQADDHQPRGPQPSPRRTGRDQPCIAGSARKLAGDLDNRVPNMGWSRVSLKKEHELFVDIDDGSYFYFLHSYALPIDECALATAEHSKSFTAILSSKNFYGTQFHPERSADAGAQLLRNFLALST